jgi:hypothetical protein
MTWVQSTGFLGRQLSSQRPWPPYYLQHDSRLRLRKKLKRMSHEGKPTEKRTRDAKIIPRYLPRDLFGGKQSGLALRSCDRQKAADEKVPHHSLVLSKTAHQSSIGKSQRILADDSIATSQLRYK